MAKGYSLAETQAVIHHCCLMCLQEILNHYLDHCNCQKWGIHYHYFIYRLRYYAKESLCQTSIVLQILWSIVGLFIVDMNELNLLKQSGRLKKFTIPQYK